MNDPVMKAINDFLVMPDRPSQPPHLVYSGDKFDEWDNELFKDLCGKRQGPVIQDLLILLSQMDMTDKSFGVSPTRFLEMAAPMLRKLREACLDDFKEL